MQEKPGMRPDESVSEYVDRITKPVRKVVTPNKKQEEQYHALLQEAEEFIHEHKIICSCQLAELNHGLYSRLLKATSVETAVSMRRRKMDDEWLVEKVREFCKQKRITSVKTLQKLDSYLHDELKSRNLLAALFPEKKPVIVRDARTAKLIEAIEQFGVEDAEDKE